MSARARLFRSLIALAMLMVCACAFADTDSAASKPASRSIVDRVKSTPIDIGPPVPGTSSASSSYVPSVWCTQIDDAKTKASCWGAYRASLDYYDAGLTHRLRVLRWQHISTMLIFFSVLIIVFSGLFFAWLQFRRDMHSPADAPQADHTVVLNMQGIQVRSSVLGVVILTLSIAFFYLYLRYAYPIVEVF